MAQVVRNCPDCCRDYPFEQLHDRACPDSPDGECPEWMCAACGSALLTGMPVPAGARPSAGREVTRRARVA